MPAVIPCRESTEALRVEVPYFIGLTAEYSAACSGDECRQTLFGEANVIPRSLLRGEFIF
jgi:hypothetical protein